MNNISTPCDKKTKTSIPERHPRPETIAIIRYFAQSYSAGRRDVKMTGRQSLFSGS